MTQNQPSIEEARKLKEKGRLADAALLYSEIARHEPDNAQLYYEWGCVAYNRGFLKNARKLLERARKLDFDIAGVHSKLGSIYAQFGWCGWAQQSFEKAISLDKNFMPAYYNMALMQADILQDFWSAEETARRGLRQDRNYGLLYTVFGKALYMQGKTDEAIPAFEKAVRLLPEAKAENLCNLATIYADRSDKQKAQQILKKALQFKPDFTDAHIKYSGLHRYRKNDAHIAEMEALLEKIPEKSEEATELSYALAKAYDDVGDYDRAFPHYMRGNWITRAGIVYDTDETKANFNRIKKAFAGDFEKAGLKRRKKDLTPVFIVGMPRSGTTLAEQILFSHPDVGVGGEVIYFERLQSEYGFGRFDDYGGDIRRFPAESLKAIREDYLSRLARHAPGKAIVTDKLLGNFRFIGLIRMIFPQARIIHCRRDPIDTCFSIYKQNFKGYLPFAYDLKELAEYYKCYEDLMAFWHKKLPGFIHDVQYEELVADQKGETRRLLGFCDLPWNDRCLAFHEQERTVITASMFQVKKPLYKTGIGQWERYEKHLAVLKEAFAPD